MVSARLSGRSGSNMPRSKYRINDPLAYLYEPLRLAKDRIRLIELLPDKPNSDLRCRFFERHITSIPYEALSYTWDGETKPCSLYVGRHHIQITSNLSSALHHLRYTDRSRFLWVDAVSINQACNKERNHQVRIMSSIYHQAQEVIVWLGTSKLRGENSTTSDKISSVICISCQPFCDNLTDRGFWQELLHSTWFRRIWVIQEVVHASHITVRFGNAQLEWSDLVDVAAFVHQVDNVFDNPLKNDPKCLQSAETILLMHVWRNFFREDKRMSSSLRIEDVVHKVRASECTWEVDKIYSMLSLVPRSDGSLLFDPDYRLCLDDVEFRLAQASISNYESLNILRYVDHGRSTIILPSWVPHFRPDHVEPLPISTRRSCFDRDDICIAHRTMKSSFDGTIRDVRLLCLQGSAVLEVGCVGSVICGPGVSTPQASRKSSFELSRRPGLEGTSLDASPNSGGKLAIHEQDQRAFSRFLQDQYLQQESGSTIRGRKPPVPHLSGSRHQTTTSSVLTIEPAYETAVNFPALAEIDFKGRATTTWPTKVKASPQAIARGRKIALTRGGTYVLVPSMTEAGDLIAMFAGIRLLFIIRLFCRGPNRMPWYNLIGACETEERMETTLEKHWRTIEREHNQLDPIILC